MAVEQTNGHANGHTNGVNGATNGTTNGTSTKPYTIPNRGHSDPDKIRVICVGAGFSGVCMAYKLQAHAVNYELAVYEKNDDVGGTWYENKYPGCACDIPAPVYSFSFEPNASWTSYYASAPEIEKYIVNFVAKYNLSQYIQLNSRVVAAVWDEARGEYYVDVQTPTGPIKDRCHVLVSASGVLNKWKWPAIPSLHDFQGKLVHSAHWDDTVDCKGKRVAVLGTGSSAIQIIPSLQPEVEHLTAFIRSPTWISPAVATDFVENAVVPTGTTKPVQTAFVKNQLTREQIKKFESDPDEYLALRKRIESIMNASTDVFVAGTDMNEGARKMMTEVMEKRLGEGNEELKKHLIPTWPPGCRRLTPGDGYLEALVQPNVTRVFGEISNVDATGLTTDDGVHHDVDIIICATGFDVAFTPPFSLKGRGAKLIHDEWKAEPVCYLGLAAPQFPNYFICLGPRGPWGNGPLLPAIETLCDYFLQAVIRMQEDQIKSMEVKLTPTVQFNNHVDEWMKTSVWKTHCRSWYKMGTVDGKAWLWPGNTLSYLKTIKQPRYEDYTIHYKNDNMWAYLGNGKTLSEISPEGRDLAPYIRNTDTPWAVY
ncbi:hypothetical protein SEUCBS139899_005576 [Sporothrix eucalyptigena]|uniref:L-ornithine N(5)-monooxygenase [NAD(P)H] n=1 Tax=Sporothrix eucalyptigena TaxID=1812306 RepID=A0ABP0C1B5_9PEZI